LRRGELSSSACGRAPSFPFRRRPPSARNTESPSFLESATLPIPLNTLFFHSYPVGKRGSPQSRKEGLPPSLYGGLCYSGNMLFRPFFPSLLSFVVPVSPPFSPPISTQYRIFLLLPCLSSPFILASVEEFHPLFSFLSCARHALSFPSRRRPLPFSVNCRAFPIEDSPLSPSSNVERSLVPFSSRLKKSLPTPSRSTFLSPPFSKFLPPPPLILRRIEPLPLDIEKEKKFS